MINPEHYNKTFPKWPPVVTTDRWVYGVWMLGQNYKSKQKYYGEYPPGYLKRIKALFPNAERVLHLFSGVVEKGVWDDETTIDINPGLSPDVVGDAEELGSLFPANSFDLIVADPPYSQEDAEHYGTILVNRKKVLHQCREVVDTGGYLVWLDQVYPMHRKDEWNLVGTIGIIRSTNHRVRFVFIFQAM